MINHSLNSATTALSQNRLATIALAAERLAFERTGGVVEKLGTTKARTLNLRRVHQMQMQSSKGKV
tara:strand:- start:1492 stop:1689 length:198 start_codon:yes stop_codon:yes gene_type:complete